MKRKILLFPAACIAGLFLGGCAPLVTSGTDVMIGGGIYPPPVLAPPMGNPNMYRPGGPFGPGFVHGAPAGKPGRPSYPGINAPAPNPGRPGNPGLNTPTPNPGRPGMNQPVTNPGNQRVPGQGVVINPGGNQGGTPPAGSGNVGGGENRNPGGRR